MIRFLLSLAFCILALGWGLAAADASTAAAFSAADGNMGLGNGRTVSSAQSQALANCGGTAARVVASNAGNGWCAICKSRNARGQWVFGVALARPSQRNAATAARANLVRNGGVLDRNGYFLISSFLNQF